VVDVAGAKNEAGDVPGMVRHPDDLVEAIHGGLDGRGPFERAVGTPAARSVR